ncbi:GNAT family N-acetyltransferase [Jiangella mangrovi]|uniref:GNAT superfamily N-acetyltransferase n=1 Tax=Jiangella mangrovi TaxID=1524084 RepID=A0A7W9GKP9_9ACTN|nr:GNAT family N-acetyltransferase [Jiangella mangrovi]MBB5785598.1 GNAT superfamily N-acetyltransferase [Jiangella mangrovi]
MSASFAVRPRTDDDLPACASVLAGVQARDGYPVDDIADPAGFLTPPGLLGAWVAASADGSVAGHVALSEPSPSYAPALLWSRESGEPLDRLGVLGRLFVAPAARGSGLGARLVAAVVDECARLGRRPLLDVVVKDAAAVRLYDRLGWTRFGTVTLRFPSGPVDAHCYVDLR